jgi:heat-inducible transcriptional repressor
VTRNPSESVISDRAQHFLRVLIERYIQDGQPVGSRTLAKDAGLHLSPATIRNVMADLEDLGFVASPHTSAGRIPTVSGYRLFVDSLLSLKPVGESMLRQAQAQFLPTEQPADLVDSASRLLSDLTHLAGVVMVPRQNQIKVRQIEFVPLSETRILTVIVTVNRRDLQPYHRAVACFHAVRAGAAEQLHHRSLRRPRSRGHPQAGRE